jgi:predicted flap endonuclease-1-like 5' DNA nuclease
MNRVVKLEGVGDSHEKKLKSAGINSVESLLDKGASASGRKGIAEETGISPTIILKLVNHADLFRIKGVAGEYAELLEAAGVDSVPELAHRRADNLHSKMAETNAAKNLVRRLPAKSVIQRWIDQAKTLPKVVTH